MKILQLNREYLARLGIEPSPLPKNHSITNTKNLLVCILLNLNILLGYLFLCYDANSIEEYVNCFFWTITSIAVLFDYILYVYDVKSLLKFIENFENLIEKSKLNANNKHLLFPIRQVAWFYFSQPYERITKCSLLLKDYQIQRQRPFTIYPQGK